MGMVTDDVMDAQGNSVPGVFIHNIWERKWRVGDCVYPYVSPVCLGKIVEIELRRAPGQDRWTPNGEEAYSEQVKLVWLRETTRNKYGDDWMPTNMFKSMSQLIADHERKAKNFREQVEELDAL